MVGNKRRFIIGATIGSMPAAVFAAENRKRVQAKEPRSLKMPWEKEYGYAQAVKFGDAIYISGQISHDESGNIVGTGDIEVQMRQCYKNIENLLSSYGATLQNLVEEVLHVTDIDMAYAAACRCRKDIFSGAPVLASTMIQVQRLAFPELMIEIRGLARV